VDVDVDVDVDDNGVDGVPRCVGKGCNRTMRDASEMDVRQMRRRAALSRAQAPGLHSAESRLIVQNSHHLYDCAPPRPPRGVTLPLPPRPPRGPNPPRGAPPRPS